MFSQNLFQRKPASLPNLFDTVHNSPDSFYKHFNDNLPRDKRRITILLGLFN
ncbi:hypothetical protein ACLK4E_10650 [Leptospira borgpetersenii]|uniref:Uncharacterized protein n=1 Tax=Leptospira borgpetersenii serovar Ballum TaxID=280505 RepID=A0A0S2IRX1_LEPBO|nr:hypothetical protein [Leptospira borgpetersenii]ALO26400.1 hypothetical protein LBBP_02138 [Leptospira borgpetersenii serovar Ballum]EKQ99995.1 hypothetical protein LEP1GSC121_3765 [Leptospira borgpetersenii serovar Castellonis str. 200801910]EMO11625.1 hypothetical protein LEP1GSC137_3338 [Leptospira borgpetersenii str. Noumea 25]MBE8251845.1 hypothetical protein [Leptospira borgpetersenii serovar Ballum]MBE8337786.1 hypothetical protein [Leptospira borgpetersenii serovar Ballum]